MNSHAAQPTSLHTLAARSLWRNRQLNVEIMSRGRAWLDNGTHESLQDASQFIVSLEHERCIVWNDASLVIDESALSGKDAQDAVFETLGGFA